MPIIVRTVPRPVRLERPFASTSESKLGWQGREQRSYISTALSQDGRNSRGCEIVRFQRFAWSGRGTGSCQPGRRQRARVYATHRSECGRDCSQAHRFHEHLQQSIPRTLVAFQRGPTGDRRCPQRHGHSRTIALARSNGSDGRGWRSGRRHAFHPRAWDAPNYVHSTAIGFRSCKGAP